MTHGPINIRFSLFILGEKFDVSRGKEEQGMCMAMCVICVGGGVKECGLRGHVAEGAMVNG